MNAFPPLTDRELIELFGRYTATEDTALRYVALSDMDERESLERLAELRRRWRRMGVIK